MQLKKYQEKAVRLITEFLQELQLTNSPKRSFIAITNTPYNDTTFHSTPYFCLKIPTGGGKTLVACHVTQKIQELYQKQTAGIVMWFVPSEPIQTQTVKKLKDRKDAHRRVLDEAFDNNVKIFTIQEALKIQKSDVENNLCIIISTLQSFRLKDESRDKYKVYQDNGALLTHFENIAEQELLKDDSGEVKKSLANVIRLHKPLIVIDEGHRSKSELSIDFLTNLQPSFVIEYSATPREGSNILVDIKSYELKEEQMVKLPLVLDSHAKWEDCVKEGIIKRNELEKVAKKDKDYIRPIALLQAQQEKDAETKITIADLKYFLIKELKISESEIAIKTAKQNDLENVDLFSKSCQIRYIITVNALAEGWDCSFAYVLISVANIGSKISVEQIIGRIMRMPYARTRQFGELNRSYVFASAKNFNEATNIIIDGLEQNGYSKFDFIGASKEEQNNEISYKRKFNQDFSVPIFHLHNDELTFEDLLGDSFVLHEQKSLFSYNAHNDTDAQVIIDVNKNDKLETNTVKKLSTQKVLKLTPRERNSTKTDLVNWLDKKLKYSFLDGKDKRQFIESQLATIKEYSVADLSYNRFVLEQQLDTCIHTILESYAKKQFEKNLSNGKISLKASENFPESITLSDKSVQEYEKNYYGVTEKLNKEEQRFVERLNLDGLSNIQFWIRNREKVDPFYLRGWRKNKFYPDFIALTTKSNILVLEWKGEDRLSNDDTKYKEEVGQIWEKLGKGKLHFFLVNNKNVESVFLKLKEL
jgi:superfamily II DNA or RNA helicase